MELHCIDPWSVYADKVASEVEATFDHNTRLALSKSKKSVQLVKHRGNSTAILPQLLVDHAGSFDLVYVDGSHMQVDVLFDAVLGFGLLKVGAFMVFDDYLWSDGTPGHAPKPAVDAFINIYQSKLCNVRRVPLYQFWVQKIAN
ncbi:MAG: class I SAM-dependent methyltransferase [Hyphomicrobiaceae bacterium]